MSMRTFERAIEKTKQSNGRGIYFYTIPSGFKNNNELLEYFTQRGYCAKIVDGDDGKGILHISW